LKSITEKVIEAIEENKGEIDNKLYQQITITVTDGKVQLVRQEVLFKIK
jgi:hypothetical protein